jgi:hypothetical protein
MRRAGQSEQTAWNADKRCSAPPWQCACAYSCSHSSIAGTFQLGVVYLPEELGEITALQQ